MHITDCLRRFTDLVEFSIAFQDLFGPDNFLVAEPVEDEIAEIGSSKGTIPL